MKPGKTHTVDANQQVPRRYREVEQALEKEKNTNIQLHVQLTNTQQELQQVRAERKRFVFCHTISFRSYPRISAESYPRINGQNVEG